MICEWCGNESKRKLCRHHIDGDHSNDNALNIAYICRHCHARAHIGPNIGKHWAVRLPYGWPCPRIPFAQVRSEYERCFPHG